jgi:hypothetical protein
MWTDSLGEQLKTKTVELDRLQQAGEVLRRIIRVRELTEKLRKHMQQVSISCPLHKKTYFPPFSREG